LLPTRRGWFLLSIVPGFRSGVCANPASPVAHQGEGAKNSDSAVNLGTGKLVATVKVPSDLPAAPAVTGSDAIYELNPEFCMHAGPAGQGPDNS
jgi:hypothetical protein